jgi:DNA-directed RNA polymerase specialized sigma24 family protein
MADTPRTVRDEEAGLHARLLAGDAVAPAELCERFLPRLEARSRRAFPHADPHLRLEAVHETLLKFAERPGRYDPLVAPLGAYLCGVLWRRLVRLLQKERRERHLPLRLVELASPEGNKEEEDDPAARLDRAALAAGLSRDERLVLELLRAGEHSTAVIAAALGLRGTRAEQRREVKRIRDRVIKRLKRDGGFGERSAS